MIYLLYKIKEDKELIMAVISKNKILLDKLMNKLKMGEKINMPLIETSHNFTRRAH